MALVASFFTDLTTLRREGVVGKDRVEAARTACRGGHPIGDLTQLAAYLNDRFPEGLGYFDSSISEGDFPKAIAAFQVSVCGKWSRIDQHGIYLVFGYHLCERVQEAKEAFASKEKYRDQLAGAKQHYANGLMYCVREAHGAGDEVLRLCCLAEPMPLLEAAQLAVKAQRLAATLRAEKYASRGGSGSHVFSYKSALENLAVACRILGEVDPPNAVKNSKVAESLEKKASSLSLSGDAKLLEACSRGEGISAEAESRVMQEKRAAAATRCLLPAAAATPAAQMCVACGSAAPTHWGYTCRCLCLCEGCIETDTVMDCPRCGDLSEFVRAS